MEQPQSAPESQGQSPADTEKQKKALQRYREHVQDVLKACDFKQINDKCYSLKVGGKPYIFRLPNIGEKAKIEFILTQVLDTPDGQKGMVSAEEEVLRSGNMTLISFAMLSSRLPVLAEKLPEDFDLEKMDEAEQIELGYNIYICEREMGEIKKKALRGGQ